MYYSLRQVTFTIIAAHLISGTIAITLVTRNQRKLVKQIKKEPMIGSFLYPACMLPICEIPVVPEGEPVIAAADPWF